MLYFGIDPGTKVTGYGIIRIENNTIFYENAGTIRPGAKGSLWEKLEAIYDGLSVKMQEYCPHFVCVEQAFYAKNVHTTLILGHTRGVVLLAAQKMGAGIVEFTPREIKKALVGNGNASKEQVAYMVKTLLRLPDQDFCLDVYDALAVAICAFYCSRSY